MYHAQIILNRLEATGKSMYRVSKDTGISVSLFSKWKKAPDTYVTSQNLELLADYLGCSIDYLLGRAETPQFNQNPFSDEELKLVRNFRELNDEGRFKLADYADDLVSSKKYIKSNKAELDKQRA